jgi:hypothetical protein
LFILGDEKKVIVYCREEDHKYLTQQSSKIADAFKNKSGIDCSLTINTENYLPKDGFFYF